VGSSEVARAGLAVVRLDRRIEEAQIGHRAVGDEAALEFIAAAALQRLERLLYPGRAPAQALELRRAKARDELLLVRRLVRAFRMVDVELEIAPIRIRFIDHRRIDPLREH